jgi:hypothetical protein
MQPVKASERTKKAVADILTQFMFTNDMDDVMEVWENVYRQYSLCRDPFTGTPCTEQEFCVNLAEYEKQAMIEKYGHCDGL